MKGIQYIVDDNGEETAVVIDLKQWGNEWERFYSLLPKDLFPDEEWLHKTDVEEKLNKALEWNDSNPPQMSDLDSLERELNNSHEVINN